MPVLLMVRAMAFQDLVILKICLTFRGTLGSCSSLLKSPSSSVLFLGSAGAAACCCWDLFAGSWPSARDDPGARIFLAMEQPILNILQLVIAAAACNGASDLREHFRRPCNCKL